MFVLDAADLLAPATTRPALPGAPEAHADLFRHLLLPTTTARTGHRVDVAAVGTRVLATHLDGHPIRLSETTSVLRARTVLAGDRVSLQRTHVLAYAAERDDLAALLGDDLTDPHPGTTLDLRLVLAGAAAGLRAADLAAAHRTGTLTADRVDLLAALLAPW
ncbi:hypothetical protein CLV37_101306 [Kineococcus rhizosphaerae]|uniref:Uncharacterized protein n=1 Tax=Kineococcus rhizosphaerae TaxID=559628 RepID=A0A2T0RA73_9ACTN|nr:hypothetical protein CLV37_101306 [Kineococcus rhizosphaerae]